MMLHPEAAMKDQIIDLSDGDQLSADMAFPGLCRTKVGFYTTFAKRIGNSSPPPSSYPLSQLLKPCFSRLSPSGSRSLHILDVQSSFTDYELERSTFNLTVPQRFNFARDVIDVWASAEQVLALVFVRAQYTVHSTM